MEEFNVSQVTSQLKRTETQERAGCPLDLKQKLKQGGLMDINIDQCDNSQCREKKYVLLTKEV